MSISNEKFFCKKCSGDGPDLDTVPGCNTAIRNGYTCDEYDRTKEDEIIEEINNAWKEKYGNDLSDKNYINKSILYFRTGKPMIKGERVISSPGDPYADEEYEFEIRKVYDNTTDKATWEYENSNGEWKNYIDDYFHARTNESIKSNSKKLIKENMEQIPQMIDDKLREFNFYTVDPKKGKQKISFTDDDRELMKNNFVDMSEKYPEDIAFIRSVVSCRDIDDKTNEPFVRLGSYRDSSNINLPFSKRVNGLEKVLDGGINYFTIMNNPGPDNRDFKIVPGDRIKDVDFDEETKEMMSQPESQPQQPMRKEEPFEEVMKNKERKGLASLMEKGELSNDFTKSQKKIIEKLKREGYLFKQPVDEGGYKKMRVKSKEFTEAFEVWKKS